MNEKFVVMEDGSKKGGVSQALFYCIFNGFESITGYMVETEHDMQAHLENTIAVLVYDRAVGKSSFIAGILFKTSYNSSDQEFEKMLQAYVLQNDRINKSLSSPSNAGMIFAKVGVRGDEPLSENEMTHFLYSMMVKYVESPSV